MSVRKPRVTDPRKDLRDIGITPRDLVSLVLHPLIQAELKRKGMTVRHVTADRVDGDGIVIEATIHNNPVR